MTVFETHNIFYVATTATHPTFGMWVHNGGSVRGYQAIFVSLAAVSSPGYGPLDGQPAVYFNLSHKRHEDLIDPYIWDICSKQRYIL